MLKIPRIVQTDTEGFFVSSGKNEFAQYAPDTDEVAFLTVSRDFCVTLNEMECEVRDCRVSAIPFNRPWPGHQRAFNQTEAAGFIRFEADEAVSVCVRAKKEFKKAILRPLSRNITPSVSESGDVSFTLTEAGSYVLELDDSHGALHIFFDKPHDYPEASGATYYFGAGMHFPGYIFLRDNDSVYIDSEATVFGSLCSTGAKNVRIFGGGIIDGCFEERMTENCYENHTKGNIRLYNCENLSIEGIILKNSASWALALFGCRNVNIDGVKIVGQWRYNTDGIDLVNSSNVTVKNCFVRSFDDTVTIKGIYHFDGAIENITVENCVLWCGWGNTCEIGIETAAKEYRNICFKNCDVIHTSGPAISVLGGNEAVISDITYENINVEFSSDLQPPIVQKSEAQIYDPSEASVKQRFIHIENRPYAIRQKCPTSVVRASSETLGVIRGVRFKGIRVLTDSENITPAIKILCLGESENISDVCIEELFFNGEKQIDLSHFEVSFDNFSENIFKA